MLEANGKTYQKYLYPEASLFSMPMPRIPLFFFVLLVELVASVLAAAGFVLKEPACLLAGTALWIVWFAGMFMIASPATDALLRKGYDRLKRGAIVIIIALLALGIGEITILALFHSVITPIPDTPGLHQTLAQNLAALKHDFRYNDATALCHQAVENFIGKKNPYTNSNLVTALESTGGSFDRVTPLRQGVFAEQFPYPDIEQLREIWLKALADPGQVPVELESGLTYPAGSFLLPSPFMLAGINDIRIIYAVFVLAAIVYTLVLIRKDRKVIFLCISLVSLEIWNSIAYGETGTLAFAFLLPGWALARKYPWQSAVFMGIAIATKQTAWFFVPFYLIMVFRTAGMRRLLKVAGTVAAIFAAANAPFIVIDAGAWFYSVLAPMTDKMFPIGVGLITLVTSGAVDIRSQLLFAGLEILTWILCIAWYWKNGERYPETGPVLAVLPLFFAWRSLWTYFFYVSIIVMGSIIVNETGASPARKRV